MSADLIARPERSDIVNAYRLALGRDPETVAVVDEKLDQRNADWLPSFFKSPEFRDKVYNKALRDERLDGGYFSGPPEPGLVRWAADFIPLSPPGRRRVESSTDWYDLFHSLFADETFSRSVLDEDPRPTEDPLLQALEAAHRSAALSQIEGEVEVVSADDIRGWAIDLRDLDRVLELELYVDAVFVAAGPTALFRRDIQDRYGGEGHRGFLIRIPPSARQENALFGEVREAASKVSLGSFRMPAPRAPPLDDVAMIRRELRELRALLDRIESRLPAFNSAFGFSLENYNAYFEAYYAPLEAQVVPGKDTADLTVVIDGSGLPTAALHLALESVERQGLRPRQVVVVSEGADARIESEMLLSSWERRLGATVSMRGVFVGDQGWSAAMNAAVTCASAPRLLFFPADAVLAPSTVAAFTTALDAGADLVFADEDEVEPASGRRAAVHSNPTFRTAFDRDLLLQQDCVGELFAVTRERVSGLGFRAGHQAARFYDLMLRMTESHAREGVIHLPQVLLHRRMADSSARQQPDPEVMLAAVQDHLVRTSPATSVSLHKDVLGAGLSPRVHRAQERPIQAAIIIPTRDRVDLLGPCLASLSTAAQKTKTPTEIIIVDNQSTQAETRAFLEEHSQLDHIRVIEYDGAFNWALINNRAADQTDADVLIFLNNDTVVLTPDWCDELCANALRPDVGAVGARLLYEDGTIQHAGVVLSEWHGLTAHEGMGAPGSDPGYLGRHMLLREVSAVTGACLATRAKLFRDVGGFDALAFPVEGNDTDYCLRLRSQGYRILYNPYATLYHFESKSRGYNTSEVKKRGAEAAGRTLRSRWGERFEKDVFYNPHFDRLSPPFTRLRPPNPGETPF